MTLNSRIESELNRVAVGAGRDLQLDVPGGQLRTTGLRVDSIGCEFVELEFQTSALAGRTTDQLVEIGQRLSERLTYLMEPISPLEVDNERCVVQMRSAPPSKNEEGTFYYELTVAAGGSMTLCRYQKVVGQPRATVSAQLTRQAFTRLAVDLAEGGVP